MKLLKFTSKPAVIPDQPNTRRRSFMWKVGAAIPALLASAVPGRPGSGVHQDSGLKNQVDRLSGQLGVLEDENAILRLHQTYEDLLHRGRYEEVIDLFTDNGEVQFNGGIFKGKFGGVRRLYSERFKPGLTGRKIEPPPEFRPESCQQQGIVKVATDRKSARAGFSYSIQVGTPIISDSQLVKMARLHGEGIMRWWEGGICEVSYDRDMRSGVWKIRKLEYRVLSKADYRPGKSHAKPISILPFSKVYPEDPAGPDLLTDSSERVLTTAW